MRQRLTNKAGPPPGANNKEIFQGTDVSDAQSTKNALVPPQEGPGETAGSVSGQPPTIKDDEAGQKGKPAQSIGTGRFRFENRLFIWFALAMLFFSLFLLYRVFDLFINTVILACVFSAVCYPFYAFFLRRVHRKFIAASLVLLCWILLAVSVLAFLIIGITPQAIQSVNAISDWLAGAHIKEWGTQYIDPIIAWLQEEIPILDIGSFDLRGSLLALSRQTGQIILNWSTFLVTNTVKLIFHFFIMLLVMFTLFIHGEGLIQRLEYLFPLKPEQTKVIMRSLQRTAKAVLVGGFLVAAAQGIAAGMAFAIVGLPALFWGMVMIFAAMVPAVGTGLIWFPAAVYMLITGRWKSALFLFLWCGLGVSFLDTLLRPYLLRGGNNIPVVLLFLAIIGGLNAFGALGLLYGPMILGFATVMLDIYSEEFHLVLSGRTNGSSAGK